MPTSSNSPPTYSQIQTSIREVREARLLIDLAAITFLNQFPPSAAPFADNALRSLQTASQAAKNAIDALSNQTPREKIN
jgi:hypothetical protein